MVESLLMVLMAVFWAGGFVSGKLSVAAAPPEVVAFLRFFVAGVVLLALMAGRWRELRFTRRDLPLVLGLGASGVAGYNLLFFGGLQISPASDAAMIIPTLNPLLTLILAVPLLGERLTPRKLGGAALSIAGQMLIFYTLIRVASQDPSRLAGDLYYVGSAVCWSTYTILGRIAARRFTPMASTTIASVIGALMLLPFAAWQFPGSTGYTLPFWGHILYMGLGATVAGFCLWAWGLERLGASRAAIFLNLVPVFTLILAALFLGERPSAVQVGGMVLVMGGVFLASTGKRPTAALAESR